MIALHIKPTFPPVEYETVFHSIFEILLNIEKGILQNLNDIAAVGHRVVHGGSRFAESALITPKVETAIDQCIPLAPLHNPYNLGGIHACRQALPNATHVAVFDTAFPPNDAGLCLYVCTSLLAL